MIDTDSLFILSVPHLIIEDLSIWYYQLFERSQGSQVINYDQTGVWGE